MKDIKGRLGGRKKNTRKIVLPQNDSVKCNLSEKEELSQPSGINVELLVSMDINKLISGIDGYVWATKNLQQAEIISNAIRVQNIELEIVNVSFENAMMHLIKVKNEEDIKNVIDFIQNDKSGLRLKPDWTYPDGERNESFDQWINH